MMMTFLQVAIGGAVGSVLRFAAGLAMLRLSGDGIPLGMVVVNVLGSFLMGVVAVWSFHKGFAHLTPFLMAGLLGGFTTFSAFSLEAFTLYERGEVAAAAAYVAVSVGLSVGALALGVILARGLWA